MKKIIALSMVLVSPLWAEEDRYSVTREIDDCPKAFFEPAENFYSSLGKDTDDDILSVSKTIKGVPENKICVSQSIRFAMYGSPKFFLCGSVTLGRDRKGYLVCAIYPYKQNESYNIIEAPSLAWIQGQRRFDLWQKEDGKWKVVLNVGIQANNLERIQNGNEKMFFDNVKDASRFVKKVMSSELESNKIEETTITEALKRKNLIQK
jgi:hypothetical protein